MNQRKVKSMRSKLSRLAKNECASYKDEACAVQRCGQCIVAIETDSMPGNVCGYFVRSVLPAVPELHAEYVDTFPKGHALRNEKPKLSDCKRCGESFEKRGNAAKYCDDCRALNDRDKARARKQKERRQTSRN
ncbi:hypothetical protein V3595_17290 [Bacillus sp. CFBP9009]